MDDTRNVDAPDRRRSKWDDSPEARSPTIPSIKRRLVRPKKIRRPDDSLLDSANSTPGAGPSTASPTSPRRSASPSSRPSTPPLPPFTRQSEGTRRPPPPRSNLAPTRSAHPPLLPCRSVYNYTRLNHIEEGTYGVVFRAKCNDTGGIYALKKLKLEEEKQGFPITSLREVMALMVAGGHENVVGIREIVVGETLNQYARTICLSGQRRLTEYAGSSSSCLSSSTTSRPSSRTCLTHSSNRRSRPS